MPRCGSQVFLCDVPIRFDTYEGCTHGCKYCFATKKQGGDDFYRNIRKGESLDQLKSFVEGKRNEEVSWCDWNIPLHFGGMSDPLQPIEKQKGYTYECLQYLAETQYPFILSTKGKLLGDKKYIDILNKCNCVIQVSAVSSLFDEIEKGCPTFEERLTIIEKISPYVKRVIIRVQPYVTEVKDDILKNINRYKEAGVYGLIIEAMKYTRKKKGLVKVGGDWTYPLDIIKNDILNIKRECHKNGLKLYSGENRTRTLGDSLCCCGIEKLPGFKGNSFNLNHLLNGDNVIPTENMKKVGTANVFKALEQKTANGRRLKKESFAGEMINLAVNKKEFVAEVFGKKIKKD